MNKQELIFEWLINDQWIDYKTFTSYMKIINIKSELLIIWKECTTKAFGTALTTILPILFQYCYKYCYSDSRNFWAVMVL